MVRDDLPLAVCGCSDRYSTEADLLFWEENGSGLRSIPYFWRNLPASENSFVHVEDVLPPLIGLHEASEARHSTLPLGALLARGQADVNSHYTLLDASFFVQLSQSF